MSFLQEVIGVMLLIEGVVMFLAGRAWEKGERWW